MNLCLRMTGMELWNGIRRPKFWLITGCFVLLMFLDTLPMLYAGRTVSEEGAHIFHTDIISMSLATANGATFLFWLRFCLYVIPYGCCFYEEYSQQAVKYRIGRCSCISYGVSKILVCIILTALCVWVAEAVYAAAMLCQGVKLILPKQEGNYLYFMYRMVEEGHYIGFWLLNSFFKCFAGIFFSSMTLALSTFIKNKYVLIAAPLTLFFSLDSFSGLWFDNGRTQPDWINWRVLFFWLTDGAPQTEGTAMIRTALYTLIAVVLFGVIFIGRIRKAAENE